ncbi:MAG: DNA repair protein RecO [Caldilineales bacterium]|nr:DNA repair protein RecO [Caldilineales bacterium]
MPRERTYRTRAIILKHRDQGEADRVITAITPAQGKCTLIAKGVRKPASRKAGHLEPFTHVALLAAKARGWDIITQAESIHSFPGLRADIDRMAFAYYFAELVDAFTQEEDSQPEVYDLLLRALGYLEQGENLEMAARWFELRLLRLSGYQPQLFQCLECGEPLQPVTNYLSLERGGMLCPRHGEGVAGAEPLGVGVLKILRYVQSQPYAVLAQLTLSPARGRQVEGLLASYIRYVLERKLKSPQFIQQVTRLR